MHFFCQTLRERKLGALYNHMQNFKANLLTNYTANTAIF